MNQILNADAFMTEIKKLNFTGKDFLEIIGNSKISNDIFNEIKSNEGLTYQGLIRLLDNSALTAEDYARILKDAQEIARIKAGGAPRVNNARSDNVERLGLALVEAQKRQEAKEQERAMQTAQLEKTAILLAEAKRKAEEKLIAEQQIPHTIELREEAGDVMFQTGEIDEQLTINTGQPAMSGEIKLVEEPESEGDLKPIVLQDDSVYEVPAYEDYDEYELTNDEVATVTVSENKSKLILCFMMSVVLILSSFGLRFFHTGSFLIERDKKIIFTIPETYIELAERLMNTDDLVSELLVPGADYRLENLKETAKTILYNDHYIFNIIDNELYVLEYIRGKMFKSAVVDYNGLDLKAREMYLLDERLYVILEGEYEGSYYHEVEIGPEDLNAEIVGFAPPIEGTFAQKTTSVFVYDALDFSEKPLLEFTQDGEYNSVIFHKKNLLLLTDYTPHEPLAFSDLNAFVPSYKILGESEFVSIGNIYAPPARLMNTEMTVVGVFGEDEMQVYAAVGGRGEAYAGEKSLYINQAGKQVVKFDFTNISQSAFLNVKGVIPAGSIDERSGIVRIGMLTDKGSSLLILNDELELISQVTNIAQETAGSPMNLLFDKERAYFIDKLNSKIFAFDTSEPNDVIPSDEMLPRFYDDEFYRISDKERLEIFIETDNSDNRAGIRLNVHKADKIIATYLIIVESSVAGNWNKFLFTDAEASREAVFISEERSIIIIPVKYSNSISNIEKILVFDYNEFTGLALRNELVYHDINAERRRSVLIDGYVYSFFDTMAVSMSELDGTVMQKMAMD